MRASGFCLVGDETRLALTKVRLLMTKVHTPKYPLMMKPAKMHLISLIPLPAAYGAKALTSQAQAVDKTPCYDRR